MMCDMRGLHKIEPLMKHLAFAISIFAAACSAPDSKETGCNPVGDNKYIPIELTRAEALQVEADNAFALDFIKRANALEPGKDIFVSPLSLALALGMAYNGAAGGTKADIETALRRNGLTSQEINDYYRKIAQALLSADATTDMRIANSIWTRLGFPVLENFYQANRSYYNAEARALDFDSPQAADEINCWCSDNTEGKIKAVIDRIPPETVMYILNATYFKGVWANKFDPGKTVEGDFTASGGQVRRTPFMKRTLKAGYCSDATIEAAELPYGNGAFSMVVVMPRTGTVDDMVGGLTAEKWAAWTTFRNVELHLELPKFKMEYEQTLNGILCDMGMGVAFDAARADFSAINPDGGLFISTVKQKAFVSVDEEGTEAAAVTVIGIGTTSISDPEKVPFVADRPFLFVIRERSTGAIIFAGIYGK